MSTIKDNLIEGQVVESQNLGKYFADEWSLYRVPVYRALSTIVLIYLFAIGVDWIKTLCTDGMKIIFSLTLICSCGYFGDFSCRILNFNL